MEVEYSFVVNSIILIASVSLEAMVLGQVGLKNLDKFGLILMGACLVTFFVRFLSLLWH